MLIAGERESRRRESIIDTSSAFDHNGSQSTIFSTVVCFEKQVRLSPAAQSSLVAIVVILDDNRQIDFLTLQHFTLHHPRMADCKRTSVAYVRDRASV